MSEIKFRWDIINHLIKKHNYKSYLEIGYYKGWSFDRVECKDKTAVDPNPCKYPEQEKLPEGTKEVHRVVYEKELGSSCSELIFKMTSDEFFKMNWGGDDCGSLKWDIIFIDGLHESQQVDRDIQNALKHLSPSGTIVMHDCNPSTYEMTTTGTASGEWCGDVYKSFLRAKLRNIDSYVIDTDYGVGILKGNYKEADKHSLHIINTMTWNWFDENRKKLLNLISVEEFLQREKINE